MKHAVRTLIQIIAVVLLVFGALAIGLEFAHYRVQVRSHAQTIHTNFWYYIIGTILIVVGVILFLGSESLADQLTDDIDDDE